MNNLLNFLARHSSWFVFTVYAVLASLMLFGSHNPYQQSVYLTSASRVASTIYNGMNKVSAYFHLKDVNDDLLQRNGDLEMELVELRREVTDLRLQLGDSAMPPAMQRYHFIRAHVIIDRGSADGVQAEMGVVDQNGVVGIVNITGPHASRIISLLNPYMRLSCKIKGRDYFGSLVWDGKSPQYAVLEELPKHIRFNKGDTVVTSGFSAVFPEGLMVGIVEGNARGDEESFVSLKVRLSANFSQLSGVRIITDDMSDELRELELADEAATDPKAKAKDKPTEKPKEKPKGSSQTPPTTGKQ